MSDDSQYRAIMHDGPLRWRIQSTTRHDVEHLVELHRNGGIGKCTCEHFTYRLQPKIDQGCRVETATRCHHILVARRSFTDLIIATLGKHEQAAATEAGETSGQDGIRNLNEI